LEFPEVFYGLRPGTERVIERLGGAGFDAVVGNPPYVRQEAVKLDKDWYQRGFANTYDAANDLYVYFLEPEIEHVRPKGLVGLIVADKWLRSGYGRKLRKYLI
jgi:type I restriction-modification system DNA methylase subunit